MITLSFFFPPVNLLCLEGMAELLEDYGLVTPEKIPGCTRHEHYIFFNLQPTLKQKLCTPPHIPAIYK